MMLKQMKWLALRFTFLLAPMVFNCVAHAQDFDCTKSETLPQIGLTYCTYQSFLDADKRLNSVWKNARKYAQGLDEDATDFAPPNAVKNLLKAQRAWIDFRDGHCEVVAGSWAGGSGQRMILNSCLADVTELRVKQLRALLEEN